MNGRDKSRLQDMLDNARKIVQFARGRTRDALGADDMFAYAPIHALEIIGEAARNVSQELQEQTQEVQWKPIMSMRHRIAHDYLHVDQDIVWNVIQNNIPELIRQLESILANMTD